MHNPKFNGAEAVGKNSAAIKIYPWSIPPLLMQLVRKPVPKDCSYYCHIKSWIIVNTLIIKHLTQPGLVLTIRLEISVAHPDLFHLS